MVVDGVGVDEIDEDVLMLDPPCDVEVSGDCPIDDVLVNEEPGATIETPDVVLKEDKEDPALDAVFVSEESPVSAVETAFVVVVVDMSCMLVEDSEVAAADLVVLVVVSAGTRAGSTDTH